MQHLLSFAPAQSTGIIGESGRCNELLAQFPFDFGSFGGHILSFALGSECSAKFQGCIHKLVRKLHASGFASLAQGPLFTHLRRIYRRKWNVPLQWLGNCFWSGKKFLSVNRNAKQKDHGSIKDPLSFEYEVDNLKNRWFHVYQLDLVSWLCHTS